MDLRTLLRGQTVYKLFLALFSLFFLCAWNTPQPPVIQDKAVYQYFKILRDKVDNVRVVTVAPNGVTLGRRGDVLLFDNGATFSIFAEITSPNGFVWQNLAIGTAASTTKRTRCMVIEKLAAADDHYPMGSWNTSTTVDDVWCTCKGTCSTKATFTLEHGSSPGIGISGTNPTCTVIGTIPTAATISTNGIFSARESLKFNVTNTPSPDATDTYELCVDYE